MDEEVASSGSPAMRWGVTLGIVLSVLGILDQAVSTIFQRQSQAQNLGQTTLAPVSVTLICLLPFLALVLTFGTGILAGREDGTVGSAARAGLFGVVIYTVITSITQFVLFANTSPSLWSTLFSTPELSHIATGSLILSTTCLIIVYGLIGMGVAALGGLIGRALYPYDEEPESYPAYGGWDPAYGPPPPYAPPPDWNPAYGPPPPYAAPPAYGAPPGYAAPPGYSAPPPMSGNRPTQPPPPPLPDVRPQ